MNSNCCNNVYPDEDLNRWESCPSTMLANADNFYNKHQIDEMLEDIEASGTCECDLSEIEDELDELSGELDKKLDASAYTPTDLSDYYTKSETDNEIANAGYLTPFDIKTINHISLVGEGDIEIGSGGTVDLSNYYNKQEVDAIASGKAETSAVTAHTSNTAIHVSSNEKYNWNNKANVWCGSQQEYDAITTKQQNTIYLIHD